MNSQFIGGAQPGLSVNHWIVPVLVNFLILNR
jgi:hypothetical protein